MSTILDAARLSRSIILRAYLTIAPGDTAPTPFAVAADVQTSTGWMLACDSVPKVIDHSTDPRVVYTFVVWGHRDADRPTIRDPRITQLDLTAFGNIWVAYPGDEYRTHDLPGIDTVLARVQLRQAA